LVEQAEEVLHTALRDIMDLSDGVVESADFLGEGDRVLGHTWTGVQTDPRGGEGKRSHRPPGPTR